VTNPVNGYKETSSELPIGNFLEKDIASKYNRQKGKRTRKNYPFVPAKEIDR
jgi:hypothetical protein